MNYFSLVSVFCLLVAGGHAAEIAASSTTAAASSTSGSTPKTTLTSEPVTATSAAEEATTSAPVTEIPEELTTIIEIEEPVDGNGTEFDFLNLPGYGVVDDANSTQNASSFSCYNRRYGYYADIPKKCLMFHLCYPVQEPTTGQILFQRFSFVCSDNAIFDQQHLVCVENDTLSYPCAESENYFISSNDKLIEQMQQQQQQQQYLQQGQSEQQPQQLTQAQMIQLQQQLQHNAAQSQQSQGGEPQGDPAALAAAQAAYAEYARELAAQGSAEGNSTELDAAQQYAILEQLFG